MKKVISMILLLAMISVSGVSAFAEDTNGVSNFTQDKIATIGYVHPEYGVLIDYEEIVEEDGSITRECLYELQQPSLYGTVGTKTFTKTATPSVYKGGATCTMKITATFDWDSNAKTVYVHDVDGRVSKIYSGSVTKEFSTWGGQGTKKAWAIFHCTWKPRRGYAKEQTLKIQCDYNGNKS